VIKKYPKLFDEQDYYFSIAKFLIEIGEDTFLETYKDIFRFIPIEYFRWYDQRINHWGLLYNEEKILFGIYGLCQTSVNIAGKCFSASLCHNVGIKKEYEGKGFFQYIGDKTLNSVLKDDNYALGFPNILSTRGHIKIGWNQLSTVSFYSYKGIPTKFSSKYDVVKVDKFDDEIDQLFKNGYKYISFSVYKDKDYLNWRLNKPEADYSCFLFKDSINVLGYIIIKKFNKDSINKMHIVDFFALNLKVYDEMIKFAINEYQVSGCELFNSWAVDNTIYSDLFLKNDFEKSSDYSYPIILFNKKDDSFIYKIDKTNILITLFDNDVY
jgi:hypothetical protein